jgi:hypothetical protein
MATFTASAAQSTAPTVYAPNQDITRVVTYSLGASASAGDVFRMVNLPVGAIVSRVQAAINGHSGVLTVNIGDGNDVSRYGASVVLSGSAVALTSIPSRGIGYEYTAEDTVDIQIGAISAAVAAGALKVVVTYTNQD